MIINKVTSRFYQVRIDADFQIRGSGAFGDESPTMEWTQAIELWQGMLFLNPCQLTVNGDELIVQQWSFVIIPPGSTCAIKWLGEAPYVYDYFGFNFGGESGTYRALPQQVDLGMAGHFWDIEFRKGLSNIRSSNSHVVSTARAMIWSVTESPEVKKRNVYVAEAERLIVAQPESSLKIAHLAATLGISQNQLCRLFVIEHGITPKQFVRNYQASLAHSLLTTSVEPIKGVAIACGFPNLHHFNRFTRSRFGASPREIRAGKAPKDIFRVETYRLRLEDSGASL